VSGFENEDKGKDHTLARAEMHNARTGVVAVNAHKTGSVSVCPLRNVLAKPDLEIKERHETTSLPRSS